MDADEVEKRFEAVKGNYGISFRLKKEQIAIVVATAQNKNTLCLLPTGFGKTLCIVLPSIINGNLM